MTKRNFKRPLLGIGFLCVFPYTSAVMMLAEYNITLVTNRIIFPIPADPALFQIHSHLAPLNAASYYERGIVNEIYSSRTHKSFWNIYVF